MSEMALMAQLTQLPHCVCGGHGKPMGLIYGENVSIGIYSMASRAKDQFL